MRPDVFVQIPPVAGTALCQQKPRRVDRLVPVQPGLQVLRAELVIHGGLQPSELIGPGIDADAEAAEAERFVNVHGAKVVRIRVQADCPEAQFKQMLQQQGQQALSQTLVLHRGNAELDPDLCKSL